MSRQISHKRPALNFWEPTPQMLALGEEVPRYGNARISAGADEAYSHIDPCRDLSADQAGCNVSFRSIQEPTGNPVQYEKVVSGVGPVDRDRRAKSGPEKKVTARPKTVKETIAARRRSV